MTGSGDELDRLALNLNEMLGRIDELMAGLREVSDNIAHDLRTPLAVARAKLERALDNESGTEQLRDALEADTISLHMNIDAQLVKRITKQVRAAAKS